MSSFHTTLAFIVAMCHQLSPLNRQPIKNYACFILLQPKTIQRLATGWTTRGSNPGRGKIFRIRPDRPRARAAMGIESFSLELRRPWRGVDHPQPFRVEIKEGVKLYLYTPYEPSWPVPARHLPVFFTVLKQSFSKM